MAKRKRNIQILFCVSPEEKKLIRRKMIESKTKNMGAYLRKMAIDGYIVNTDTRRNAHHQIQCHVSSQQVLCRFRPSAPCPLSVMFFRCYCLPDAAWKYPFRTA